MSCQQCSRRFSLVRQKNVLAHIHTHTQIPSASIELKTPATQIRQSPSTSTAHPSESARALKSGRGDVTRVQSPSTLPKNKNKKLLLNVTCSFFMSASVFVCMYVGTCLAYLMCLCVVFIVCCVLQQLIFYFMFFC